MGELRGEVLFRLLGRAGGDADLHQHGLGALGKVEVQLEVGRVAAGAVARLDAATQAVAPEGEAIYGAAEVQGVAQLVMLGPALGVVGAADGGVIDQLEVIAYDLMPPVGL